VRGVGAITLFVEDLAAAKAFYANMFRLEQAFEDADSVAFRLGGTIVNLLRVSAASELVAPAEVGGPDAGARAQFTIWVEDVDGQVAELADRGATPLNGPMDRPWGQRTAAFADPAGHIWEFAQDLSPAD
jgi:catechol 2,3-dioxygenase-like lactoylglutathione lyase family enzyme